MPASIWLFDDQEKYLKIEAAIGLDKDFERKARLYTKDPSIAAEVIRCRKTIIVEDIQAEKNWKYRRAHKKMALKSALVAPLMIKAKPIGVLDVYVREGTQIDMVQKMPIVESFADQIASTHRQFRSLETLNTVSKLISQEINDPDLLFSRILDAAKSVLDCKHVSIFRQEDATGDWVVEATSPAGPKRDRYKTGEGLAGLVGRTGASLLVPDVRKHRAFVRGQSSSPKDERSMLLVPIKSDKEKIIGVISADIYRLDGFDQHDQYILEILADQATVAINNTELLTRVRDQADVLAKLNVLTQQVVSIQETPDTRDVLKKIAESAKDVLKADLIELYEYRQNKYRPPQVSAGEFLDERVRVRIFEDDAVFKLINKAAPRYVTDSQAADSIFMGRYTVKHANQPEKRFVLREEVKSTAVIPLRAGGENVGLMFANYRTAQAFPDEQRERIELFARQAAIVIKTAGLLEQVNTYYSRLVENSPDPIIVLDDEGWIKVFNKACEELWGYKFEDIKGHSVAVYYKTPEHAKDIGRELWRAKEQDYKILTEAWIKAKDGEIIPIDLSASLLFDEQGRHIGSIGVFKDLRVAKRMEAERVESEKLAALGRLAHTVGHDIKHDIGTVLNYTSALLADCPDEETCRIYTNIKDALWRGVDKLQNMLMAAKPKAPAQQVIGSNRIVQAVEDQMYRQARVKHIDLKIDYPEEECTVFVDTELMRQVMGNLFTNAVHAIDERRNSDPSFKDGRIDVSAHMNENALELVVRDNGCGIPEQERARIFDAFFTRKEYGSGLGLFIVKTIIENHDGTISVHSKEGCGSAFTIQLPITDIHSA